MKSTSSLFGLRRQETAEVKITTLTWLVPSGERYRASVEIQPAPEGLTARLPEPVEIGRTVWVDPGLVERRAFVRSCERSETGFVLSLGFLPREQRRQDRVPAAGRGTLHWFDASGRRSTVVTVSDVTENGVGLRAPEVVQSAGMVRLTGETWECLGWIRHHRRWDTGCSAGLELAGPAYPKNAAEYFD